MWKDSGLCTPAYFTRSPSLCCLWSMCCLGCGRIYNDDIVIILMLALYLTGWHCPDFYVPFRSLWLKLYNLLDKLGLIQCFLKSMVILLLTSADIWLGPFCLFQIMPCVKLHLICINRIRAIGFFSLFNYFINTMYTDTHS